MPIPNQGSMLRERLLVDFSRVGGSSSVQKDKISVLPSEHSYMGYGKLQRSSPPILFFPVRKKYESLKWVNK